MVIIFHLALLFFVLIIPKLWAGNHSGYLCTSYSRDFVLLLLETLNRSCDLLGNMRTLTKVQQWGTKRSDYKSCDGDPPERLVLKRGRKQANCVGACSSGIWAMAGRCGQRNRELKWNALAPLTRVWYFLFLFHEAKFFMETFQCCRLRLIVVGQGHLQRSHLVCQGFWQPTVHHPFPIWCPSAANICPVPNPFDFFLVSPTVPSSSSFPVSVSSFRDHGEYWKSVAHLLNI